MTEYREDQPRSSDAVEGLSPNPRSSLGGKELMVWTLKAHPYPTLSMDIIMGSMALVPAGMLLYSYLGDFTNGMEIFWRIIGGGGILFVLTLWLKGARQKTVYRYRITDVGGEVEYWVDYPEHMGAFFKWLSGITLFIVICLIAVEPTFIWGLAGPVGIAMGGAKFFMGWKNEKKLETYPYWHLCNFVTVDRKRRMIVVHQTRLDVGFDVHLSKELFDEYLDTLKAVLPPTAVFTETPWKW